jgi:hypothetical protein
LRQTAVKRRAAFPARGPFANRPASRYASVIVALPEPDPKDYQIKMLEMDLSIVRNQMKSQRKEGFYFGIVVGILIGVFLVPPMLHWFVKTHLISIHE